MAFADATYPSLLTAEDGPAVEVLGAERRGDLIFVCEHASNRIPEALGDLGLDADARASHIAWDPGAMEVALLLAEALDSPLVAAKFSRLVYDCNRPPEAPGAMLAVSETTEVPGNRDLSPSAREARALEIYEPFHAELSQLIDKRAAEGRAAALVTVHSFTPVFLGVSRAVELGLLHDVDSRLVDAMLPRAAALTGLRTERNAPYGPEDGVTHTLKRHAAPRGLATVMLEVRNDLLGDGAAQARVAKGISALLKESLETPGLRG